MDASEIFAELKVNYNDDYLSLPAPRAGKLTDADIQCWSESLGRPRAAVYELIALHLARGFHNFALTFRYCDDIVNDLHSVISSLDECRPPLFWEVFLAFDEGEYYHGNNRQEDPEATYTRPLIARIVEGSADGDG
jgi:hypothetical protein